VNHDVIEFGAEAVLHVVPHRAGEPLPALPLQKRAQAIAPRRWGHLGKLAGIRHFPPPHRRIASNEFGAVCSRLSLAAYHDNWSRT
jgi:hypothetical protein